MLLNTKLLKSQGMGGIFLFRNPFPGKYVNDVFILWAEREERNKKGFSSQVEHFSENSLVNVNARLVGLTSENHGILPAEPEDLTSWQEWSKGGLKRARRAVGHTIHNRTTGSTHWEHLPGELGYALIKGAPQTQTVQSEDTGKARCQPTDTLRTSLQERAGTVT